MSFKPKFNQTYKKPIETESKLIEVFTNAQNQKNLVEEIKINHKSNVFKIIKSKTQLSNEECKDLTILIDEYYSKYLTK